MRWFRRRSATARRAILGALVLAAGCGRPQAEAPARPLLDPLAPPEVITERRILEFPPSQGSTRFVQGWWGWREEHVLRMVPYARPARIEIATLEPRPRTLRFVTKVHQLPAEGAVSVLIDGREIAEIPLDPSVVEIPPLPVGRHPVDFEWPAGSEVGIEKAEFDQALPAGSARIDTDSVEQTAYSAVDFVRQVVTGARLRGRFVPPSNARDEQSFHLFVERDGEVPVEAFAWPAPWWRGSGGGFDVPLGDAEDLVRIRLLARGTGEPGRWEDLEITQPAAPVPASPPEPPAPPRLVLLYVLDALRADHVAGRGDGPSAGGATLTPTLDRLASEGVAFRDHQTLAPNTLPSTKTLFTGRPVLESNRQRLSHQGPPLLAELFQRAGYRTALLSGNGYVSDFYGVTRGFDHLDKSVLYEFHPKTDYNDNAEWVHRAALEWLGTLEPGDRGFLYLHTVHPHTPYDPPPEFLPDEAVGVESSIDGDSETLVSLRRGEIEAGTVERGLVQALYRGGLAYADAELGRLLAEIDARYAPGEVLVIVTSDHGEELFDHDGVLHGFTLYRDQLHVPLVAWWPGTLPPHEVAAPTDTQDLYVTLRRLTEAYEPPPLAGRSLWPWLLQPDDAGPEAGYRVRFAAAPGVDGGIYAAHSRSRKLIWAPRKGSQWGMGDGHGRTHEPEYVFDLTSDPGERHNLAGEPSLETDWLRSRLGAWIELGRALQPGAEEVELDTATERNLRALGYVD